MVNVFYCLNTDGLPSTCVNLRWVAKQWKTCVDLRTNLSSTKVNASQRKWVAKRNASWTQVETLHWHASTCESVWPGLYSFIDVFVKCGNGFVVNSYRPCIPVACTLARSEDVVWTFLAKKMRPNAGAKYGLSKLLLNIMKWTEIRVEFLCRWHNRRNCATKPADYSTQPSTFSSHLSEKDWETVFVSIPFPSPLPNFQPLTLGNAW